MAIITNMEETPLCGEIKVTMSGSDTWFLYENWKWRLKHDEPMWAEFDNCSRKIKRIIFNPPATIVFWADGDKTVVKAHNEDFDPEKGLAMAICKHILPKSE